MDQVRKLLSAAEHGNAPQVCSILDQGIHVDTTDEEGVNALHTAAANGHETMTRLLLSKGASLDARNCYGWSPLMLAALYGHIMVVGILLQHKADIFASNDLGATALDCAARSGHDQVVLLLIEASIDLNPGTSQKRFLIDTCLNSLMNAAQHGHEPVVKLLLGKGIGVNYNEGVTGWSPLMVAALNGYIGVVQVLSEHGADANSTNVLEQTALEIAAIRHRTDVEAYLDRKTSIRPKTRGKKPFRPCIIEASRSGDVHGVRDLLEINEADVNATDEDGATPLMFACMRGHQNVAQVLVNKGANIDAQDKISGWTALMQATYYGHRQLVKLLIDCEANVNIQAKDGCTAFDMASIIGDTEILRLLASVSMLLSLTPKTGNSHLIWSSNKLKDDVKGNVQIPIRELAKFEGPDPSKTGLKFWWSKMSSRIRNMSLVRTLRSPSSTPLKEITALSSSHWSVDHSKGGHRNSMSTNGDSNSTTTSLLTVIDSALKAGGHDVKRPKTLALGAPTTRLPEDLISPVVPPSMPVPAFELTRVQREDLHVGDEDDSTAPQVPCLCVNGKFIPDASELSKFLEDSLDNISSVSGYSTYRHRQGNQSIFIDGHNFSGSPESSYSTASFLSSVSNNSGSRTLKATTSPTHVDGPFLPASMSSLCQKPPRPTHSPSPTLITVATSSSAAGCIHPIPGLQKSSLPFSVLGHVNRNDVRDTILSFSRMPMDTTNEEEIADILKKLSLEKYSSMFEEQEVDMEAFLTLNDGDLKDLGVTRKDAREEILATIAELSTGKDSQRQHFHELTSGYGSGSPSTSTSLSRWAYPIGNLKHSR